MIIVYSQTLKISIIKDYRTLLNSYDDYKLQKKIDKYHITDICTDIMKYVHNQICL